MTWQLKRGIIRPYFHRESISIDDIRTKLWNQEIDQSNYCGAGDNYQQAIMEQYKIYVEMTDRISARRSAMNTFFILVNTSIFAIVGSLSKGSPPRAASALVIAMVILVIQCGAWYWMLRSYRQLSSAKFRVIGILEERLPAGPWYRAEWTAIGAGRDKALYWPITRLEQFVPGLYALAYFAFLIVLVAT